jgi:hypothetical protein
MNKFHHFHSLKNLSRKAVYTTLLFLFFVFSGFSQTTIQPGSFIINMGVVPQTIGNALKPYGMIYDLILNNKIPIQWIIESGKAKDGVDFNYNGVDYKGGPFIVPVEYRTPAVDARIAYWQTQGVVGVTTTSPISVPIAKTLDVSSVPRWTMDLLNGKVAVPYFTNAGIPASAYSLNKTPQELAYCDDIFVMPHAYPQWSTHSNLYFWNKTYHGSIWLSCTAGSELEDMFNPADHSQQTNFLTEKDPTIAFPTGSVTTVENALWLYSSHTNGVPPYSYTNHGDPFMQFMGNIDSATQNGLEQVYIPKAPGWRASTSIGVYDPDHIKRLDDAENHRAAIIAFGRGFGDPTRGYVMLEASHSLNNAQLPANIAAQRVFFNFSFMAGKNSNIIPNISGIPSSVVSGTPTPVSFLFPVGVNPNDFSVSWYSACGGTFVNDPTDKTKAIYTPPTVNSDTSCPITVTITDACGRVFNTSKASVITCNMQLVPILKNACNGGSNGKITMNITGAAGPYNWSYGSTSGTGTEISGLAAGSYTVTVVSGGGTGCSKTFTVSISSSPAISAINATPNNVICNGLATGSISIADVSGGTPPFTFLWSDGATTQNRSGLAAGNYSLTATDASGCSVSSATPISITQPTAITIIPTVTNVLCNGNTTGAISIAASGGTGSFSYLWNDGATTQNRTDLAAGTYSVKVTDTSNCSNTMGGIVVAQPSTALSLSASQTNVACNGGSTGAIDLTVSGGTSSYSYLWSTSATTQDISNLATGNYSVTVTDANGCSAILSKTITQPTPLSISSAVTKASCPGISDGGITLTVTGGTTSYSYSWSGPSNYASSSASPTGLLAGTYNVTVTDAKGCTATVSIIVGNSNPSPVTPGTITK